MNLVTRHYDQHTREEWQDAVNGIDGSTYLHSWDMLRYRMLFSDAKHFSFIVYDDKQPVAVVGLATYPQARSSGMEFSLPGSCCFPGFTHMSQSSFRKVSQFTFARIDEIAATEKVVSASFDHPAVTAGHARQGFIDSQNLFHAQSYGYIPAVFNCAVWNLTQEEQDLFADISKYQRRHIKQSEKKGLRVSAFTVPTSTPFTIRGMVEKMRLMHLLVSGRKTRPDSTWHAMADSCVAGDAALFVAYFEDIPVSYLFCGQHGATAFGWSQVNSPEHERALSPRHLLEWKAALHYKNAGFAFYIIGDVPFAPTFSGTPNEKEITIGQFKERYGARLYPRITWYKFYDREIESRFIEQYNANMQTFMARVASLSGPS